jgi:hypothetical protein
MTSYDNEYNRSLRNRVMGLDVANIGNDKMQASKTPLRQGGAGKKQRRKDASLLDDVDFRQGGLQGQGFFDDLLDGLKKGAEVANTSLDLYNKVGQTFGKKGMGMSGGVRRGAELSDAMAPQGVTGKMLARAPIAKGSRKGSALLAGSGMRGGYGDSSNYEPNWRKIEAAQAKDGFIGAGDSDGEMEGGDFFSDLLSGINSVAGVVGPIAQIAGKFGAGQSGGKKLSKAQQQRLAMKIAQLQGRGAGTYGMPELLGMEGSGPISDLGIPGLSQIAGLFGLGMSGGALDDGAQDPAFKTPAPAMKQDAAAQALASAFLGGRHPSKVSKAEKKMLFMKALADAKMHHELGNMMQGRGMSGGAAPLMCGLGLSGGDFFSDLLGTIGKVGQTALQVAPLFGLGDVREVGGAYQPMQGSGLTDMPALNATPSRYSYGKMGNIAGMANGAGMPAKAKKKQIKGGYLPAPPTQVGVSMSGMGQDSDSEDEEMEGGDFFNDLVGTIGNVAQTAGHLMPLFGLGEQDREVGAGKLHIVHGGGKSGWINHVKAYAAKHNCSYKDALKRAAASYRK